MKIALKLLDQNSAIVHEREADEQQFKFASLIRYEGKLYMYQRSTLGAVVETVIFVEVNEPVELV